MNKIIKFLHFYRRFNFSLNKGLFIFLQFLLFSSPLHARLSLNLDSSNTTGPHGGLVQLVGKTYLELSFDNINGVISIFPYTSSGNPLDLPVHSLSLKVKVKGGWKVLSVPLNPIPQMGDKANLSSLFIGSHDQLIGAKGFTAYVRLKMDKKSIRSVFKFTSAQKVTYYVCPMNCEAGKVYPHSGKCPVCQMSLVKDTQSHMLHASKYGGAFFMAPNKWHHIEGALPNSKEFRLYFFNNFIRPIPADEFLDLATYEILQLNDDGEILQSFERRKFDSSAGDYLKAILPTNLKFPVEFVVRIQFPRVKKKQLFNFRFNKYSPMETGSLFAQNIPLSRDGSGTSWLPDSSPVHTHYVRRGNWNTSFHGDVFIRYTNQNVLRENERGGEAIESANEFTFLARKPVSQKSQIMVRSILTLEPWTIGDGSPQLFQSDERIVDEEHPHDLISELSFSYSKLFSLDSSFFIYVAYPGEPALGPPGYQHRPSGMHNPESPLTRHWFESTHSQWGVVTLGLQSRQTKIEWSAFTGREADNNRVDFEEPKFDSFSMRFSLNPNRSLASQISFGVVTSPESTDPDFDVGKFNGSVTYNHQFSEYRNWATTFGIGVNVPIESVPNATQHGHGESAELGLLLESAYQTRNYAIYAKAEHVQRAANELRIPGQDQNLNPISGWTTGLSRTFFRSQYLTASIGAQGTVYGVAHELLPFYGNAPFSVQAYMKLDLGR